MAKCFICDHELEGEPGNLGGPPLFNCPRCGNWAAIPPAPGWNGLGIRQQLGQADDPRTLSRKSRLSHIVRRQQSGGQIGGVRPDLLSQWGVDQPLASPLEQLDELIVWIGDNQPAPNETATWTADALAAWVGVRLSEDGQPSNLYWLLTQDLAQLYIDLPGIYDTLELSLTMNGWTRYRELKAQQVTSRLAFMALEFGHPELDAVVGQCFGPAVAKAGFELRTLADGQGAGLIDDQLRVALRTCRFVVADVTHGNNGAYWEAGFAEGLGRPVIYTCEETAWNERRVHFDTNHLVTIIWSPNALELAAARLTATIRATLPTEATLTDG